MSNLMVDVETLGVESAPNVVVLSIGAVQFDLTGRDDPQDLHDNGIHLYLSPVEQIQLGAKMDWSTIQWWHMQDVLPRQIFSESLVRHTVAGALRELDKYIEDHACEYVWGNGPSFDCAILENLYRMVGMACPFKYYQQRCVRTVHEVAGMRCRKWGIAHDALDDAVAQAVSVQDCMRKILGEQKA